MAATSTLRGVLFFDSNEDGAQQGADTGLSGLQVQLFSADGTTLIGSTTSGSGGLYSFTGIAPGNYLLMVVPPQGDSFSTVGANPNLPDSTVSSTGGQQVTLTAGNTTTVNAGVYSPNAVSITGTVFVDANGDGLIDGTDKGLSGVGVQLLNSANTVVATTTTAADGTYAFNNVAPGTYTQHVVAPSGYGYAIPGSNTVPQPFVPGSVVTAANNLLSNGSFEQTTASTSSGLTGGFYGWTESTSTASTPYGAGPGLGQEIQTTNSTATGRYGVTASPDTQNTAYSGTHAAYFVDDDAIETLSQTVTLQAGQTYEVGFDLDEPSIGASNPGYFSLAASIGGQTITTTDSRSGTQLALNQWTHFADLFTPTTTGSYTLQFKYASGVPGSTLTAKDVLVDDVYIHAGQVTQNLTATSAVNANGTTTPVTRGSGQTVGNESAGLTPPPASLQGTLFNDSNDDGTLDGTDKGLSGQTVVLSSGGNVVGAAVTDSNGAYSITGLLAGTTYTVQFAAPAASVFAPAGTASGNTDSTVNASGAQTITVAAGGGVSVANAGVHTPLGIAGLPANASSTDAGPYSPFSAATVNAPDPSAATSIAIVLKNAAGTATDADGLLSGSGLVHTGAGTYTLSAASPAALSSALRALSFAPTAHQVSPGGTVPTSFNLAATQGSATAPGATTLTETATCFLAGTRILTAAGEVAVEQLAAGDSVATLVDNAIVHVPVRWIGMRHLDAAAVRRAGIRPVRIRVGAFADGIPHRDLLVTPEHCILVDGSLIPARMLVNARSIVEDAIAAFSYYHVELDAHGVLFAEGLTAESWLDTGNRAGFANAPVVSLSRAALLPEIGDGAVKDWSIHACAPLATDRATVEPIWRRLHDRACGADGTVGAADLTDDPLLRVLLDDGSEVAARWDGQGRHFFQIPRGTRPQHLLSRAAAPAEAIGPFVDDRRRLGVQVRSVVFWCGLADTAIAAEALALPGWHAAEHGARWTDGAACLDLPRAQDDDTFVEIHVVGSMRYARRDRALVLAA